MTSVKDVREYLSRTVHLKILYSKTKDWAFTNIFVAMITFIRYDTDMTTDTIVDVGFIGRKTTFISKIKLLQSLEDMLHSQERLIFFKQKFSIKICLDLLYEIWFQLRFWIDKAMKVNSSWNEFQYSKKLSVLFYRIKIWSSSSFPAALI